MHQKGDWLAVNITGLRHLWRVDVGVSINPDHASIGACLQHSRHRARTDAVVSPHSEDEIALGRLLCHTRVHLLATLADGVRVAHLMLIAGRSFGVRSARGLEANVAGVLHRPAELLKLRLKPRLADHVWTVVCAWFGLSPGHRRTDDGTLFGVDEEAGVRNVCVMYLALDARSVRPDA